MPGPSRSGAFNSVAAILATIMIGWVLHVGADILQPIVIALLLATMLQPVIQVLARFRIPPAFTVITLVVLIFLGLARLGLLLQEEVRSFVSQTPRVEQPLTPDEQSGGGAEQPPTGDTGDGQSEDPQSEGPQPGDSQSGDREPGTEELATGPGTEAETPDEADNRIRAVPERRPGGWARSIAALQEKMNDSNLPAEFVGFAVGALNDLDLRGVTAEFIGGGFDFVKGLLLVVIYMLFIFAEQAVFRRKILSVSGPRREEAVVVLDRIARGIQRYLGVKTVTSLATGTICYAVLVALSIPYAPLFGFLTFLLNYIPTFGSIVASIFPTLTALTVEPTLDKAIIVAVTYLVVNTLIGSFLEPKILGRELNLSPLVVVISVVVWAGLWGVVGGFLAVPLTSTLQIIMANYDQTRPFAVLLSSGPAREEPRWRGRRKSAGTQSAGTQSAGTQSPGTQSPGTQSPGTQSPGTQSPGTQSPGTQSPDSQSPGSQSTGTESSGEREPAA